MAWCFIMQGKTLYLQQKQGKFTFAHFLHDKILPVQTIWGGFVIVLGNNTSLQGILLIMNKIIVFLTKFMFVACVLSRLFLITQNPHRSQQITLNSLADTFKIVNHLVINVDGKLCK